MSENVSSEGLMRVRDCVLHGFRYLQTFEHFASGFTIDE